MAKRKASGASRATSSTTKATARKKNAAVKKTAGARESASRSKAPMGPSAKKAVKKAAKPARAAAARRKPAARKAALRRSPSKSKKTAATKGRVGKPRSQKKRTREETIPSPPSSLNMNRRGSAARTGRDEMAEERADHANMTPSITGGDVDANVEDAYFTGDEAPGGDNSTPDQDIVDDIGRALGVEYQDNEELRASDKVADRDKHRWELDPASAEDYPDHDEDE